MLAGFYGCSASVGLTYALSLSSKNNVVVEVWQQADHWHNQYLIMHLSYLNAESALDVGYKDSGGYGQELGFCRICP